MEKENREEGERERVALLREEQLSKSGISFSSL